MEILTVFGIITVLILAFAILAHRGQARLAAEKVLSNSVAPRSIARAAHIHLQTVGAASEETEAYCAFVDVETTGLDPRACEIVEFTIILASFDPARPNLGLQKAVAHYTGLRQPSHRIPAAAMQVHRITDDMVRGQELDLQRIADLASRASFFVAHNASFDSQFACALLPELAAKPWMCSMRSISWAAEQCSRKSLDFLCEEFQVRREAKHRSLHDTLALMNLVNTIGSDGRPFFTQIFQNLPIPKAPAKPRVRKSAKPADLNGFEGAPKTTNKKRVSKRPKSGFDVTREEAQQLDAAPADSQNLLKH